MTARQRNTSTRKPDFTEMLPVRLRKGTSAKLNRLAKRMKINRSELVRTIIQVELDRSEKRKA